MDTSKSIEEMSVEELQAHLASKRNAEKAKEQKAKKEYEEARDTSIRYLISHARQISDALHQLMHEATDRLDKQKTLLDGYGKIRGNSKGGFKIETADGRFRIIRQYRAINDYDERATKAEELMKDFLLDTVPRRGISCVRNKRRQNNLPTLHRGNKILQINKNLTHEKTTRHHHPR